MKQHKVSFLWWSHLYFVFYLRSRANFESIKFCVCSVILTLLQPPGPAGAALPLGFPQAGKILQWAAIFLLQEIVQPRDQTRVSYLMRWAGRFFATVLPVWKHYILKEWKCEVSIHHAYSVLCWAGRGRAVFFFKFARIGVFQWTFQCKCSNKVVKPDFLHISW